MFSYFKCRESEKRKCQILGRVWLFVTLWTIDTPGSSVLGTLQQEHWRGLPCPPPGHVLYPGIKPPNPRLLSPGYLLNPGIEPRSLASSAWQGDSLPLSILGSPRILKWVFIPFSRGSSWPRDRTQVSCTASKFFTIWAPREALEHREAQLKDISGTSLVIAQIYSLHHNQKYLPQICIFKLIVALLYFCVIQYLIMGGLT